MPRKTNHAPDAAELRRQAEARLKQKQTGMPARTETDLQRLVHELQVHEIELEMQNSELESARQEMEAGLEKYTDLYDFAPAGYLTLDREGTIHESNFTAAGLLGIERSRLVHRRFESCVALPDRPAFTTFIAKVFAGGTRESCEVKLLKEDQPPVEVRIEAVAGPSGRDCRAVLEDITARKRAETDRLILNKLESTGIMAGGLAHGFNNLLSIILLNLEMAAELAPPGEELVERVEEAKRATLLARGLTQQLITFARGGEPLRKPTALAGVIRDSVQLALSGSSVRGDFSLAGDLWLADVDGGQIGQVLRNLVLNAREAMPEGGTVSVQAENVTLKSGEHSSLPPGDYLRVSIADRGTGMAEDVRSRIFDPYFSTKQRGTQKGMGLGLTICHAIVLKHEGAISVESALGRGTTFHIHLPASRKLPPVVAAPAPAPRARHGKILIMDDEDGLRKALRIALLRTGHEVEAVKERQSAIEAYRDARQQGRPFDLAILDLTIPAGLGGLATFQALLTLDPGVKAIVMSGYSNDPVLLNYEHHGFQGVLDKPFKLQSLEQMLSRILGRRLPTSRP